MLQTGQPYGSEGRTADRIVDIMNATGKRQQPFTYGSLPGSKDYYFVAGK
jgi:hypothetical protein